MAGTTKSTRPTSRPGSAEHEAIAQVNNLTRDVETLRTALEAGGVVATAELMTNYATNRTYQAEIKTTYNTAVTAITELNDDDNTVCNQVDSIVTPNGVVGGSYAFTAGAAVTIAATGTVKYQIAGVQYAAEMPATITLEDLGDITQNLFGAWRVEITALGAVTAKSAPTVGGYTTEQIALLALGGLARTASSAVLGYLTVVKTGSAFNIGTDNLTVATATATFYYERGPHRRMSGLNAALGAASTLTASSTTYGHGTIDVNRNGLKLAQIAAGATQALTDADTIATLKFGAVLVCTNLAGTGKVSINAAGTPGVTAMSYADAATALAAVNLVVDRLPALFVPIILIRVNNQSVSTFTFKTTNWDATSITSTITDAAIAGWDRTVQTGFNSHQITRAAIPAILTAPNPAAIAGTTAAALASPAPSSTAVDTAGDMTASLIADLQAIELSSTR